MKQLTDKEIEYAANEIKRGVKASAVAASMDVTVAELKQAFTDFAERKKGTANVAKVLTEQDKPKIERIAGFNVERNAPPLSESMPIGYIAQLAANLNVGDVVHGLRGGTRQTIGKALKERGLRSIARSYHEGEKILWRLQVVK